MKDRRAAIAALLKDLTPGDVHVGASIWPAPKKSKRKRRIANLLRKLAGGADPGLYVCRPLSPESAEQLATWWATVDARQPLDADLHATIVYSKVEIPWDCDHGHLVVPRSNFLGFKTLGTDRALVLRFRSPALHRRWSAARSEGATWDFAAYEPHVTLFYLGSGYDSTEYGDGNYPPVPPFDLMFGPEICGPLSKDVFKGSLDGSAQLS